MDKNKFFKHVWHLNALFLLVCSILVIATFVFFGYKTFRDVTRNRNVRNIVNIDEHQPVSETWKLGSVHSINSDLTMVPLYSDQTYDQNYYDKSSLSIRNFLFIDSKSHTQTRLFNTNNFLILDHYIIFKTDDNYDYSESKEPIAIIYLIIKTDTNGDKRLTLKDNTNINISEPDGTNLRDIAQEIDSFSGYAQISENRVMLVYQKGNTGYATTVNLNNFDIETEESFSIR